MGRSTNGGICFGVKFEEDHRFPWDSEEYGGDLEEWWIYEVCKYENPFDWRYDLTEAEIDEYLQSRRDFSDTHPAPAELVNYCSSECPMYILAVPSSVVTCKRGYPETFNPVDLRTGGSQKLIDFCAALAESSLIDDDMKPQWYLTIYTD